MHGVRDEPAALVGEPDDDEVGLGQLGRARGDHGERLVERRNSGRFPGHCHACAPEEVWPFRLPRMALPERKQVEEELLDPTAVQQAYRRERLRRRAREDRRRERMLAGLRFWLAVALVIATSVTLAVLIWHEIHRLFGL